MDQTALSHHCSLETDQLIRSISGRGHLLGLSTPFTHSALHLYAAGGRLDAKTEKYMIQADFLTAGSTGRPALSQDGQALLSAHEKRGDRVFLWSTEMAAAARRQPRLAA